MIKTFALLTTLFALSFGKTCTEDQKSLFTCAEDTHCSEWSDGCNNCDCNGCTRIYCACYVEKSCLPKCLSNNSCEPRTVSDETSSDLERSNTDLNSPTVDTNLNSPTLVSSCIKKSLFDCPGDDTLCKNWSDGCNVCSCDGENPTMCTEKHCNCYDDKSCTPSCLDNDQCTLKIPLGEYSSANEDTTEEDSTVRELIQYNAPFVCPDDEICTAWSDGCNNCRSTGTNTDEASCTRMYCSCYGDKSCIPVCKDNENCVPEMTGAISPLAARAVQSTSETQGTSGAMSTLGTQVPAMFYLLAYALF